jgi:hypothetical protein
MKKNCITILAGNLWECHHLEDLAVNWRIIVHNGLRVTDCEDGSWMEMTRDRSQWRTLDFAVGYSTYEFYTALQIR